MRGLLLLGFIALSYMGSAQNKPAPGKHWKAERPLRVIVPKDSALLNIHPYITQKPGIYRLPKDGMPCIVPDTKEVAAIPNAWGGSIRSPYKSQRPIIPNPSKPHKELETK